MMTRVQPAAMAGAILLRARVTGKFQGTMAATTPTGEPSTSVSFPICEGRTSGCPSWREMRLTVHSFCEQTERHIPSRFRCAGGVPGIGQRRFVASPHRGPMALALNWKGSSFNRRGGHCCGRSAFRCRRVAGAQMSAGPDPAGRSDYLRILVVADTAVLPGSDLKMRSLSCCGGVARCCRFRAQ